MAEEEGFDLRSIREAMVGRRWFATPGRLKTWDLQFPASKGASERFLISSFFVANVAREG
jgi:hypothetical protein